MTTRCTAFTTTHWVIDRVHNYAAVAGTTTKPAAAASFARTFERVFAVTYYADSGFASSEHLAGFA
jgi:hypothetical protein